MGVEKSRFGSIVDFFLLRRGKGAWGHAELDAFVVKFGPNKGFRCNTVRTKFAMAKSYCFGTQFALLA